MKAPASRAHERQAAVAPWIFALSGAAGLIHQVAWTRLLRRVLGSGTLALTAVLCVFLGGLALGSWLGSRSIGRTRSPLRLFALLEMAIAAYAATLPWWVPELGPIWSAVHSALRGSGGESPARFVVAGLVLLPASVLMGATLPILARLGDAQVGDRGRSSRLAGTLYAFNSAGAVVGALVCGFVMLPALGLRRTVLAGAALNVAAAVAAALLAQARRGPPEPDGDGRSSVDAGPRPASVPGARPVLVLYGVAGAAALADEIAWSRALAMSLGSTTYAFSLVVATFILGLSLGGGAATRWGDRWGNGAAGPRGAMAAALTLAGLGGLAALPALGRLPLRMTGILAGDAGNFWHLSLIEFGVIASLLLVPTFGMGAAFPLAVRASALRPHSRAAGLVYAANALGTILGAAAAGLLLLPALGVRGTLLLAALGHLLVAALLLLGGPRPASWRHRSVAALLVAIGLLAPFGIPAWDPAEIGFGPFVHARRLGLEQARDREWLRSLVGGVEVLFHEDGRDATVTVKRAPDGELSLWVNGKPDASSRADLPTQALLAHLPLLLHPEPRTVMVVGLASGITAAAAAHHPLERIEIVEISPAVARASRLFDRVNGAVLDDPRVVLTLDDARHRLQVADERFDVIISEPSNPWIAGVGDLFTREYFELSRTRLGDDGLLCVWLEGNDLDGVSFRSVVRAFLDVFPTMQLWHTTASDFLLIGRRGSHRVDLERLQGAMELEGVAASLGGIAIAGPVDLLSRLVLDAAAARRFVGEASPHTDDDARLEFSAPRTMIRNPDELELIADLQRLRRGTFDWLVAEAGSDGQAVAIRRAASSRMLASAHVELANVHFARGEQQAAIERLATAARIDPGDPGLKRNVDRNLAHARDLVDAGRIDEARAYYRMLHAINPDDPDVAAGLASVERATGEE